MIVKPHHRWPENNRKKLILIKSKGLLDCKRAAMTWARPWKVSYNEGDEKLALVLIKLSGFDSNLETSFDSILDLPALWKPHFLPKYMWCIYNFKVRPSLFHSLHTITTPLKWPLLLSFSPSELTSLPAPWQYFGMSCLLRLITVPFLFLWLDFSVFSPPKCLIL